MATVGLIARLAYSHMSEHLAALQAQLKLPQPLDFASTTPNGSLLGLIMRLLRASYVGASTQWVLHNGYSRDGYQMISMADFESLRSSLLSKLQSFVPGPGSDVSRTLHLWLGQSGPMNSSVQALVDDVIAALLAKGVDPLATDADGNNTLFHLGSGDCAQLVKLLRAEAPWKACGVEIEVFHRNGAGQTVTGSISNLSNTDGQVALALIRKLETFWAQNIKPTLIHTLTHDFGMAKDAAVMCAQYIDGSSSGGNGKEAGAAAAQ